MFDNTIGELVRLLGDEKVTACAHDMLKNKLEIARAVHGDRSDAKERARSQKGRKSKGASKASTERCGTAEDWAVART